MQDKHDLATEYLVAVSVPRAVCGVGSVIYSAGGGSRPRGGGGPAPGSGALQQPRPRPRPGHVVVAAARAPRHRVGHLHRGGVMWGSARAGCEVLLQKGPSEANPKVRNHGEGPY